MPTSKKRIQIPVENRVYKELERLASKRGQSLSGITADLVEEALEIQEDLYFSREGDRRWEEYDDSKLVSHKDAWK